MARAWWEPIIAEEGEMGALIAIASRFGIEANSLEGALGLMWALLLDRLKASQSFQFCERCGQLISGKADKRFCSEEDNAECYRARKRDDKRRSRKTK